jgi:methyl-accepting chemotaxis protein
MKKKEKKPPRVKKLKSETKGSKFGKRLMFILIISLLLPVLITGSIFFVRFSAYMNNDIKNNNAVVLNEVESYIQSELNNVTQVLTILTKVDYVQKMQPFLVKSMFQNVRESYDLIVNINVIEKSGRIIFSTLDEEGEISSKYLTEALEGNVTYSDIAIFGSGTETRKVIKQAFPIYYSDGKVRGALVGDISMDDLERIVEELTLPEQAEVLIISDNGLLIAHSDEAQFEKLKKTTFETYEPFLKSEENQVNSLSIDYNNSKYLASYLKIPKLNWTVVVQIPEKSAFIERDTIRNLFVVIILGALLFGYFGSRAIAKYATNPLTQISTAALIASGGDFTVKVNDNTLKRSDEFGDVGRAFMTMVESFREIVIHLQDSSNVLDETTDALVSSSETSKEVFSSIIDQANHLQETAVSDLEHATRVVQNVSEMSEGSENVAHNTDRLNLLIKNNVEFATKGVEKMNHTAELIDETVKAYEKIERNINDLQKSAGAINGISDSIMEIANQTNLLALNAAIEAARAGEAGRGFAVVASEIRNLADQSNKSAAGITEIIKEIQTDIKTASNMFNQTSHMLVNVAKASNETVEQMGEILEDSKKAAESIDEISAVTEEHAATTAQINEMMEAMISTLEDTSNTSVGMSSLINVQKEQNEDTFLKIEEIKSVSERFKSISESFKC